MPVILWTDALIYLLVVMIAGFIWYACRHEHLRTPWRQVAKSRLGMAAAVVLAAYVLIGVLDSIHFHPRIEAVQPVTEENSELAAKTAYSSDVISVFDVVMGPVRTQVEKTYSAPFAAYGFSKEAFSAEDGSQYLEYPRLQYGGAHLEDPETERWPDIMQRSLGGVGMAAIIWIVSVMLLLCWQAFRSSDNFKSYLVRIYRRQTPVPWDTILYTYAALLLLTCIAYKLAPFYHIMGTDKVGQDVFYQAMKSIRTGLVIGTLTTLVMLPFAIFLGIAAGYFRGWVDDIVQYTYTTLVSIPGVLLIASAILLLQVYMANNAESFTNVEARADLRLLFLCLILGITSWTGLCRLLRGETLKLREIEYVQAAQAFGVSHLTIISRHILPNVMHIVLISVVLDFSSLVLAEAVLSYINIGVDPSMNSWGNMINSARLEMAREPVVWWSLMAAFTFMLGLVLSANLFSDAVRDAFDPRLRKLD
ncbi:MAG: ABC transporter permease [Gammaproteobacteria bacterium]